jgi:RimJ/RimL family protein N-acetyltransferase
LLPTYQRWISDFAVSRTLAIGLRPLTLEDEQAWYEAAIHQPNAAVFLIYERATTRPIGVTELRDIDYQHGTAEFAIMIGERDCWGRGYGTEVARLMLDYAFTALGLHNVQLRAYAFNQRGLGAYRRAGFKEFGRRRQARRLGSRRYDIVHMDCLASEFESPVLKVYLEELVSAGKSASAN